MCIRDRYNGVWQLNYNESLRKKKCFSFRSCRAIILLIILIPIYIMNLYTCMKIIRVEDKIDNMINTNCNKINSSEGLLYNCTQINKYIISYVYVYEREIF